MYKSWKVLIKESLHLGWLKFIKSFKQIWNYLFGSAGAFYATKDKLLLDIDNTIMQFINTNILLKLPLFVVVVLFVILIWHIISQIAKAFWQNWSLKRRESIYGNAIVLLSEAYSKIHANRNKELTPENVKTILIEFCNTIREIFVFKTKAKCSVSIKIFVDGDSDVRIETRVLNLCRDSQSQNRYSNRQNKNYDDIEHTIANNTCYERIISKFFSNKFKDTYFLSNDLIDMEYENSSFEMFEDYTENERKTKESRKRHWPLNYKSELVVSISPMINERNNRLPIIGFLCVDCELNRKDIFNTEYDVPLLQGVTDGLYDFIKTKLIEKK
jgi:hypothetical protein